MKSKVLVIFVGLLLWSSQSNAQVAALYTNASHCIFLRSKENLLEDGLKYLNVDRPITMLRGQKGFSIDANLKSKDNEKYINFQLSNPEDILNHSTMEITIYFKNLPDTINYYLEIKMFVPSAKLNALIYFDSNSLKKLNLVHTGTIKGNAYDITSLVFPN